MNIGYCGRTFWWDTIVEQKTAEHSRYLTGRTSRLDFSEPSPILGVTDDQKLRRRTLNLFQPEALGSKKRGVFTT